MRYPTVWRMPFLALLVIAWGGIAYAMWTTRARPTTRPSDGVILVGVGLSAACGFRIFVPLLVMNLAALSGHLHLAQGFQWLASYPATIAFSVATCLEIAGYYIPWVDHLLDSMATPAAVVAGTLLGVARGALVDQHLTIAGSQAFAGDRTRKTPQLTNTAHGTNQAVCLARTRRGTEAHQEDRR